MSQSRIIKGFLLKYLMTCVLAILVGLRILTIGLFDDLTPTWYMIIGYSIILRFLINPIQIVFSVLIGIVIKALKRWKDRRFTCDMQITRAETQADYEKMYIGETFQMDFSYSEITNVIFVTMTVGQIMPLMFIIGFFNLAVIYWKDKCYCRLVSPSDEEMQDPPSVRCCHVQDLQKDPLLCSARKPTRLHVDPRLPKCCG